MLNILPPNDFGILNLNFTNPIIFSHIYSIKIHAKSNKNLFKNPNDHKSHQILQRIQPKITNQTILQIWKLA